jgi:hypothetical protein
MNQELMAILDSLRGYSIFRHRQQWLCPAGVSSAHFQELVGAGLCQVIQLDTDTDCLAITQAGRAALQEYRILEIQKWQGNGIILGRVRHAMWDWAPGRTRLHLEGPDGSFSGWIAQGEKAEGICRRWVEDGVISINLQEVRRV